MVGFFPEQARSNPDQPVSRHLNETSPGTVDPGRRPRSSTVRTHNACRRRARVRLAARGRAPPCSRPGGHHRGPPHGPPDPEGGVRATGRRRRPSSLAARSSTVPIAPACWPRRSPWPTARARAMHLASITAGLVVSKSALVGTGATRSRRWEHPAAGSRTVAYRPPAPRSVRASTTGRGMGPRRPSAAPMRGTPSPRLTTPSHKAR